MGAVGLEHVNIVAADIAVTCAFYERLLDMEARPIPVMPDYPGRWIYDRNDNPIIHVQVHDDARHGLLGDERASTGAIDHVALACDDFEGMKARCEAMALEYRAVELPGANFRQLFVHDPDNVLLELNFRTG
jgi:catechol 2,3-dioxygenase-like lactoylglutathione lyase family enzyme